MAPAESATSESVAPPLAPSVPDALFHDEATYEKLRRRAGSRWLMRLFMLAKLPMGLIAGLRVEHVDRQRCSASVPYRWLTTNPFRSTYFAVLSMAAELSTGSLAMLATQLAKAPVAMLVVDLEGQFTKKAVGRATFTCEGGEEIFAAVRETLRTGEPAVARVETVGRMGDGTEVARFHFTWSFKKRARR